MQNVVPDFWKDRLPVKCHGLLPARPHHGPASPLGAAAVRPEAHQAEPRTHGAYKAHRAAGSVLPVC